MFTSFSSFSSMQNTRITPPPSVAQSYQIISISGQGYSIISDTLYNYYVFTSTTPISGQTYTGIINYNAINTPINTLAVSGGCPGTYSSSSSGGIGGTGGAGGNVVSATRTINGTKSVYITVGIGGQIEVVSGLPSTISFSDTALATITAPTINGGNAGGGAIGGSSSNIWIGANGANGTNPTGLPLYNSFMYGAGGGGGGAGGGSSGTGGNNGGGGGVRYINSGYSNNTSGSGSTNGPASINPGIGANGGANTGSGGGGGSGASSSGVGGSGIVVIAFPK